jgi:membrane-associated protein
MEEILANLTGLQIYVTMFYLLIQSAFISPFPEELILSTAGLLSSQGRVSLLGVMAVCQFGILCANTITFWLGRTFGAGVLSRRPMKWFFSGEKVQAAMSIIRQKGSWVVAVTRFTPLVRGPVYFAFGVSGFAWPRFFRIDFLASCVQVPLIVLIGAKAGAQGGSLMQVYGRIVMAVLLLGFVSVVARRALFRRGQLR